MNLSWLEDFIALAGSGNFSRAADERHMTQPAFSRRIRALEEWLGVSLFDRTTHPASLTEAGQWFRGVAREILARIERIPDEARAVAETGSATLRIASTHALSLSFLPGWLRSLEIQPTMGPIQLVSDVLQQCERLMQQQRAQFLLCHTHRDVPNRLDTLGFPSLPVGSDRLIPVSAADRRGQPQHRLDAGRKTRIPVLAYSAESGMGRLIRSLRGGALDALNTQTVFTAHLATVLKSIALDGRGVAWLPSSLMVDDMASGRLVCAGEPEWTIDLDIRLFRQPTAIPLAAEAFWTSLATPPRPKPPPRRRTAP